MQFFLPVHYTLLLNQVTDKQVVKQIKKVDASTQTDEEQQIDRADEIARLNVNQEIQIEQFKEQITKLLDSKQDNLKQDLLQGVVMQMEKSLESQLRPLRQFLDAINQTVQKEQQRQEILEKTPSKRSIAQDEETDKKSIQDSSKSSVANNQRCFYCDKVFDGTTKLMAHSRYHHMYRPNLHHCRICNNQNFESSDKLNQHLKQQHPEKFELLFWSQDGIFFHSKNALYKYERARAKNSKVKLE